MEESSFPKIVEKETENYQGKMSDQDDTFRDNAPMSPLSTSRSKKKFFQVNEEVSEEEEEDEDKVLDLEYKMSRVNKHQGPLSETSGEQDEEGDRFHECDSDIDNEPLPKQESDLFQDCPEGHEECADSSKNNNTFKLKNTKGAVVYD
jgi:hypothetical protein